MSELKATPGPWSVESHGDFPSGHAYEIFHKNYLVCDINADVENKEANAHLISAAPDMYKELKHCFDTAKDVLDGKPARDDQDFEAWFKRTEAALAKARGEE